MTIKEVMAKHECEKSLYFEKLSLHYKGSELNLLRYKILQELMEDVKKNLGFDNLKQEIVEKYVSECKPEWFEFDQQRQNIIEKDSLLLERIIDYIEKMLIEEEYELYGVTVKGDDVILKGECVETKADFIFSKKDNKYLVVNMKWASNPYSERAKIKKNQPIYSAQLALTYLGFHNLGEVVSEVWYVNGKDDTSEYIPPFEFRSGKNIAKASYINAEAAYAAIDEYMSFEKTVNCNNCRHKACCHFCVDTTDVQYNQMPEKTEKPTECNYTPEQKKVVFHKDGPMCVIAVPGAGKTYSLAHRLVQMLEEGISAESILFLAFTKKAANELISRVKSLLGDSIKMPYICTFNSFGYNILKQNPIMVGKRVKLADTTERLALIEQALKECPIIKNMSYNGIYLEYGLLRTLDRMFTEIKQDKSLFLERYSEKKDVAGILKVYERYTELFVANNYIGYDEQVSIVNELFKKYPHFSKKLAAQYKYIMVDEFQDVNAEQVEFIYHIAKHHNNIVVVGDDDQSIYGWRGGSHEYMLNFKTDFPTAEMVYMNDNFRSNTQILDTANSLIEYESRRYKKSLTGHKSAVFKPVYWKNAGIEDLKKIVSAAVKKYNPGDIAILSIRNKTVMEIAQTLTSNSIKVSMPKDYIKDDPVFILLHDILSMYYTGLDNNDNDAALYRVLNFFGLKITEDTKKIKSMSLYLNMIQQRKFSKIDIYEAGLLEKLQDASENTIYKTAALKLLKALKIVQYSKGSTMTLDGLSLLLLDGIHPVVDALKTMVDEKAITNTSGLFNMMENMIKYADERRVGYEPRKDAVNLLTACDSKGKEFKVVIIYNTEEFKEDNNRLLYVAMTRAKDMLYMLESAYNRCELLPHFEKNVTVRG